ncbi:hypothetical protein BRD19_11340 [Halobacteriales archaeon SW_7_65_23]|nr:MAG: hypothetical protein BRD19_11340 [Halobacteriales archaeon SW_7_65_23]
MAEAWGWEKESTGRDAVRAHRIVVEQYDAGVRCRVQTAEITHVARHDDEIVLACIREDFFGVVCSQPECPLHVLDVHVLLFEISGSLGIDVLVEEKAPVHRRLHQFEFSRTYSHQYHKL